jgi:histidinol-phosphatase (PHP family)
LIDYHVHERHSRDTWSATVENYVRAAEERGIDEVAFTTHLITAGPDVVVGIRLHEIPEYLEEIRRAQETTKVRLLAGLEVDYFPQEERRIEKILGEHSLDIVLGSTHYVNGVDIGSRRQAEEFFAGRPISEGADEYYTVWRGAIESGLFDVMAHPDYWRKYIHIFRRPVGWDDFGSAVYDCLDSLVSHGVGIEVNTSGYRHGVGGSFPLQQFLDASYKAGVRTVTVGSDSHTPSQLGYRLGEAEEQLRRAGYSTLSSFRGRKNHSIPM